MKKVFVWAFLALLLAYIVLAMTLPTDPQVLSRLNISQAEARALTLTIVIPITVIYLSALYGATLVLDYAHSIRQSKEGKHFKDISAGLVVLALSLPLTSIVGSLTSYIRHQHPEFLSDISILRNYITLIFAFTALFLISRGARGLYYTLKNKPTPSSYVELAGPIALASVYTWLITTQHHGTGQPAQDAYFLPNWLIILTLAIPYTFIWSAGIRAVVQLHRYSGKVKGIVYRRAIDSLAKGVAFIILVSVSIQLLSTLNEQVNRLNLTPLLTVIYILLIMYAFGFGLVARGAKRLKQIEEA